MKTRIKITEYNNGRKEFACQYDDFKWDLWLFMFFSIILTIPAIKFLIFRDWKMFRKINEEVTDKDIVPAIFSNLEDAKEFIKQKLQEETDRLFEKYKNGIKKTYKLKYP